MSKPTCYESDITQFLHQYREQDPSVEERQLEGRARLWDKAQDIELQERLRAARVSQRPYVYQND